MEKYLKEILAEIKNINTRIDSLETKFERRFDAIDKKFDAIDKRFEIIEGKMDEQYGLLSALEHRTEENTAQLTAMGEDIIYIKKDLSNINKRLDYQICRIAKFEEVLELRKAVNS